MFPPMKLALPKSKPIVAIGALLAISLSAASAEAQVCGVLPNGAVVFADSSNQCSAFVPMVLVPGQPVTSGQAGPFTTGPTMRFTTGPLGPLTTRTGPFTTGVNGPFTTPGAPVTTTPRR